jgi:hypothetical protein
VGAVEQDLAGIIAEYGQRSRGTKVFEREVELRRRV